MKFQSKRHLEIIKNVKKTGY